VSLASVIVAGDILGCSWLSSTPKDAGEHADRPVLHVVSGLQG
jgi:hypothetical protein